MADSTPDKIGWLFIQEYYSRLNSDPLHLYQFYTKQSTLIHGYEGESSQVAKGQQQVQNRVKQQKLFQECTVLVSSVDCLGSLGGGVVIQVTGEINNVAGRNVKFAQTFVLAPTESQKGYYVLNDILRFLGENEDGEEQIERDGEGEGEKDGEGEKESEKEAGESSVSASATTSTSAPASASASAPVPVPVPVPAPSAASSGSPAPAATKATPPKKKIFYSAYLKNVVDEVDQKALRQALEKAGQVTHLQIETDKSRAFVDFVDQESLERALEMQIIRLGSVNVVIEPRKRRKPVK